MRLSLVLALALAVASLFALNCRPTAEELASRRVYLTPIATAREMGITPYWVGTEFSVGETDALLTFGTFEPAYVDSADALSLRYVRKTDGARLLHLLSLDGDDRLHVHQSLEVPTVLSVTKRDLEVAGHPAELRTYSSSLGGLEGHVVIIEFPGATIMARVASTNAQAEEDENPLLDLDALLAVLEGLRPVPLEAS